MNTPIQDGGPAFPFACQGPTTAPEIYYGMTLRDYFAAKSLAPLIHAALDWDHEKWDATAEHAYLIADAMLKARNQ